MSDSAAPFRGCYIATVTPFDRNNHLNSPALQDHCRWLVESGIDGLCPVGTTGEFLFLSQAEKMEAIQQTTEAVDGRVPVIAGIWAASVAESQALAISAASAHASGVFLPPPIYYPANDDAIYRWYSEIKSVTDLPLFAYNIPQYAANAISYACLDRLFGDEVIAGVKDSTGKLDRVSELVLRYGELGTVFAASDGFASEGRRIGAHGFISAIGNITPALFARLWAGDDSLQPRVDSIRTALKQVGSIPAIKYLLSQSGFPFGESRIPCSQLTAEQQNALDTLLEEINLD